MDIDLKLWFWLLPSVVAFWPIKNKPDKIISVAIAENTPKPLAEELLLAQTLLVRELIELE